MTVLIHHILAVTGYLKSKLRKRRHMNWLAVHRVEYIPAMETETTWLMVAGTCGTVCSHLGGSGAESMLGVRLGYHP